MKSSRDASEDFKPFGSGQHDLKTRDNNYLIIPSGLTQAVSSNIRVDSVESVSLNVRKKITMASALPAS